MQKGQHICASREYLTSIFKECMAAIQDHGFIKLEWSAGSNRSISQNGLYWMWMADLAMSFNNRSKDGSEWSKDDMHDLMRHKFLGYENKTIGSTELQPLLKSTTKLDKGEMHHYMTQIDVWAQEVGVYLAHPDDSEYMKLEARQND
jgi:hypothetical protein